jgi:phospholipase C
MNDIRDPEYAEQLAFESPDEFLRRREFLQRTAATAGIAAGMATALNPNLIVAEAAKRQRKPLPSPRNIPIGTFVVLMMENRSFDHYLGWMPNADGMQAGLKYRDKKGKLHATRPFAPDYQGCDYEDPAHGFSSSRESHNHGKMDGFRRASDNDDFALSYYREKDLPFLPKAAKAFTTYDRFFCSLLGPTYPNREYMHAATSYGTTSNDLPVEDQGFPDTTIFAAAKKKGVDGRYFFNDLPAAGLWGAPGLQRSSRVEEYYARCAAGTLPPITYVDPAFAGADEGTSADDHPHADVRAGQAFMADVVHAFMESAHWKRGALFIVYDEGGGFFDHVPPPRVPDFRASSDYDKDFGLMGFRIPAVVVSPWVKRNHVSHGVFGFESIIKMIRYRYGIPALNRRDSYARNIARSFDFESKPRLEPPALPDPPAIAGQPCASQENARAMARPKPHDLWKMYSSGYLDRLGFDYRPATIDTMFRQPSTVQSGLRSGK